MSVGIRIKARRTTGSDPPPDLPFGELAYSDANQRFYIGRPAPLPPSMFLGGQTDYSPQIEALETSQGTQDTAIAALATDVAALETSQGTQDTAIAALATDVAALATDVAALATDVAALETAPPPVTGWTAVGATEPTAPAAGATWWEKTAGGVTVGQWEWTGSLWVALATRTVQAENSNALPALNTGFGLNGPLYFRHLKLRFNHSTPRDAGNYYEIRAGFVSRNNALMAETGLAITQGLAVNADLTATPAQVLNHVPDANNQVGHLRIYSTAVGAPGGWQGRVAWAVTFSEVRS